MAKKQKWHPITGCTMCLSSSIIRFPEYPVAYCLITGTELSVPMDQGKFMPDCPLPDAPEEGAADETL